MKVANENQFRGKGLCKKVLTSEWLQTNRKDAAIVKRLLHSPSLNQ